LVVSRNRSWPGVEIIRDLSEFDPDQYSPEVFVIGGAEIYAQLIGRCRELLITRIKCEYDGDVYFPEYESKFGLIEQIRETPDYVIERWTREGRAPDFARPTSRPVLDRSQAGGQGYAKA
jgi:dihydrofolate reductase